MTSSLAVYILAAEEYVQNTEYVQNKYIDTEYGVQNVHKYIDTLN